MTDEKNQPIEVVFMFDTTGSMSPCISEVKRNVEAALAPLLKEMPNLRIGIGAHGDYCDAGRPYVTTWQDLTKDLYTLTQFVRNVERTGGGDAEECYELALHEAQDLNWTVNAKKVLVMIGDERPHAQNYHLNTKKLDWKTEAGKLKDMGVQVYAVQALSRSYARAFWESMASITGGYHLELGQFSEIVDLITGIVYQQESPERLARFEEEVVSKKRMNRSLDTSLGKLLNRDPKTGRFKAIAKDLFPVPPGRFQVLNVEAAMDIRGFVTAHDLEFKVGRGFYEFTKTEEIQEKKEVVLRDKTTGDMFSGEQARNMIGVPLGTRGRVRPNGLAYDVFVQSTSYNRKLTPGTRFLYEVDMDR